MMKASLTVPAALFLAGCGGSGTTSTGSYLELIELNPTLAESFDPRTRTSIAAMPTTGTATYTGTMSYTGSYLPTPTVSARLASVAESQLRAASLVEFNVTSDLSLTTNFERLEVTGDATNFRSSSPDYQVAGELEIVGNIIGNTFQADVVGRMSETTNLSRAEGNVNGEILGDFLGSQADSIAGTGVISTDFGVLNGQEIGTTFQASLD